MQRPAGLITGKIQTPWEWSEDVAGVVKYPIKEPTSDAADKLSEAAELTQLAWGHLSDTASPDIEKVQFHFLKGGYFRTPLLGLWVGIPPWRGNSPQGCLLRLRERFVPILVWMSNTHLCLKTDFSSFKTIALILLQKQCTLPYNSYSYL